jgi:murein L,D-transpeptidase YafK
MSNSIYLYAVYAKNNGQTKIPVYVFPFQMTAQNMAVYKAKNKDNKELTDFWDNLSNAYNKFTQDKTELSFSVDENGDYKF